MSGITSHRINVTPCFMSTAGEIQCRVSYLTPGRNVSHLTGQDVGVTLSEISSAGIKLFSVQQELAWLPSGSYFSQAAAEAISQTQAIVEMAVRVR